MICWWVNISSLLCSGISAMSTRSQNRFSISTLHHFPAAPRAQTICLKHKCPCGALDTLCARSCSMIMRKCSHHAAAGSNRKMCCLCLFNVCDRGLVCLQEEERGISKACEFRFMSETHFELQMGINRGSLSLESTSLTGLLNPTDICKWKREVWASQSKKNTNCV